MMKRLMKQMAVAAGFDRFVVRHSDAGIILGLHHVDEPDRSLFSQRISPISTGMFEKTLQYLSSLGYSFVSLSDMVDNPLRSKKVAITFDDGYKSIYTNAFPVLRKFHAPFTVFLTTSTLGATRLLWQHRIYMAADRLAPEEIYRVMERCALQTQRHDSLKKTLGFLVRQESPAKLLLFADELASQAGFTEAADMDLAERLYLKPDEVTAMTRDGMTVGAHGHTHWCLEILDEAQTEAEIALCQEKIKEAFGVPAEHYSYPFGKSNSYIKPVLKRHGFKSLCTTVPGLIQANADSFALSRLMIGADTDEVDLAGQIMLPHVQRWVLQK